MSRLKILIIVFFIVLAGSGYIMYGALYGSEDSKEAAPTPSAQTKVGERLAQLRRLKTLQFDTSVLKDPFFRSLAPETEVIIQTDTSSTGRLNPFLPF